MSFEEPKAPIVRIRKKKTKRKSKDNDIVHLPVRASRQTRYSSLTTPTNPQTKSRECCRHIFASCFKIPMCRTLCFRCILPPCYNGDGSDDDDIDDVDARDEGYHSQNRRSSEVIPTASGSDAGPGNAQAIEMTEVKQESTLFIPPPRNIPKDYRNDASSRKGRVNGTVKGASGGQHTDFEECGEVTYIEVEHVSLSEDRDDIPDSEHFSNAILSVRLPESNSAEKDCLEVGYEEPIQAGVSEMDLADEIEKMLASRCELSVEHNDEDTSRKAVEISEYVECDNEDFSDESQHYVNESILHAKVESLEDVAPSDSNSTVKTDTKAATYANISGQKETNPHSNVSNPQDSSSCSIEFEKPHDYINLKSGEATTDSHDSAELVVEGMVNTLKDDLETLKQKCVSDKANKNAENRNTNTTKIEAKPVEKTPVSDTTKIEANAEEKTSVSDTTKIEAKSVEKTSVSDTESNNQLEEEREHVINVNDKETLLKVEKCIDRGSVSSDGDTDNTVPIIAPDESTDQTKLI